MALKNVFITGSIFVLFALGIALSAIHYSFGILTILTGILSGALITSGLKIQNKKFLYISLASLFILMTAAYITMVELLV